MKKVVVLDGYGNCGKKIVGNLTGIGDITLLIVGRNVSKAPALVEKLQTRSAACLEPMQVDIFADGYPPSLMAISPDLVIHTSGPFQGQDYRMSKAFTACGA